VFIFIFNIDCRLVFGYNGYIRNEDREQFKERMMNEVFEKVKELGIEWDRHASDLYIPVTEETIEIIDSYKFKCNVTRFKSEIDGTMWFDIPFALIGYKEIRS